MVFYLFVFYRNVFAIRDPTVDVQRKGRMISSRYHAPSTGARSGSILQQAAAAQSCVSHIR